MTKEKLTMDHIKQDLEMQRKLQKSRKGESRSIYIGGCAILAIVALILKSIFISVIIFAFAVYHIVLYIKEKREFKEKENTIKDIIKRGDISISVKTLLNISEETIYEPHYQNSASNRGSVDLDKLITVFNFEGGSSWRVPNIQALYEWSKEFCLSPKGLYNTSVQGNEFYFVSLQGHYEISYIYPCKFFELDKSLIK